MVEDDKFHWISIIVEDVCLTIIALTALWAIVEVSARLPYGVATYVLTLLLLIIFTVFGSKFTDRL